MTDHPQINNYLSGQRWFSGKDRPFEVTGLIRLALLPGQPPVTLELVTVTDDLGTDTVYSLPLSSYGEIQHRLDHAYVGSWEDPDLGPVHAYDAMHDREAMQGILRAFDRAETLPAADPGHRVEFHRLVGHDLDQGMHSTVFGGEQSNTSVAFGDDSLMKLFRKPAPGRNPDIEIHHALTAAGSENVAALYGWIEIPDPDGAGPLQLAMLQQFLRTASDGWQAALASVRNLFGEGDLHAEEVGGDFAGESFRLGMAVAEVHQILREHFTSESVDAPEVAAGMQARLEAALRVVPALAEYADPARALFDRLASLGEPLTTQRVHGDLHLGQTLRTTKGWKLVDFEGEPAKPLSVRVLPDSPWRDVAGMLRSFDYAARSVEQDLSSDPAEAAQLSYRAGEWAARNQQAFLDGYVEQSTGESGSLSAVQQLVAAAYELDKAVYEVVYEAQNRPAWIGIPLNAVARLTKEGTP